ncbi:MAG: hypothetical protein ABGZ53_26305 [Fuerstiella sp.]
MRPALMDSILLCGLMVAGSLVRAPEATAQLRELPTKPRTVRKVVADGRHNAFAAFVKWKGEYWLAFRKGTGHVASDGDLIVLRSQDTTEWKESVRLDVSGDDRDAQLLATEKRLFLYINSLHDGRFEATVCFTDDDHTWNKPQQVYQKGFILWKPVEYEGRYYAGAHRPAAIKDRTSHLVTSTDGIQWEKVSTIRSGQGESETTLSFDSHGRLTAFLRSQVTVGGAILESTRPYTQWKERPAGIHLSGHSLTTFDGVTYLISRILAYDPPVEPSTPRSALSDHKLDQATMVYTYEGGRLKPYCLLGPLDGNHDSSYAAAVREGDDMLVIYHRSGHEYGGEFQEKDSADLFLVRVPLKSSGP